MGGLGMARRGGLLRLFGGPCRGPGPCRRRSLGRGRKRRWRGWTLGRTCCCGGGGGDGGRRWRRVRDEAIVSLVGPGWLGWWLRCYSMGIGARCRAESQVLGSRKSRRDGCRMGDTPLADGRAVDWTWGRKMLARCRASSRLGAEEYRPWLRLCRGLRSVVFSVDLSVQVCLGLVGNRRTALLSSIFHAFPLCCFRMR